MGYKLREVASGLWRFSALIPQMLNVYRRAGRAYFVSSSLLTIYDGAVVSISIYLTKLLIDEAESLWIAHQANEPIDYTTLSLLIGGQIAVWTAALTTEVLWRPMRTILGKRANYVAHVDLAAKASRVPYRYYEDPTFYNKLEAAEQKKDWPEYTAIFLFQAVSNIVSLVSIAGLLSLFSGWLSLLVIVAAIPYFLAQLRYIVDGQELFHYRSLDRRRLEYQVKVLCDRAYAKEVRLFGFAQHWLANYKALWEKCYRENRALFLVRNKVVLVAGLPRIAAATAIYIFIVLRASQGSISLGDLAMGLAATVQFSQATTLVANGIAQLFRCSLFISDYFEFMNLPEDNKNATAQPPPVRPETPAVRKPMISFRNVSFQYPGERGHVLHDVSFDLYDSETIALVGRNGAGKTTLAKLLCGLLEPTEGTVLFRGQVVHADSPNALREATSAVFQDFAQYEQTVEDNIRLGDVDRPDTEAVARAARLDRVLTGLPDGLQTPLGRSLDGTDLSVGQWQHVALARCLHKADAQVLILDEPTAAMDPEAEYELYNLLVDIAGSQTTILVSHRLSTVRAANRVLVLDEGRLCEEGSHEELLQLDGIYAKFFRMQAERYQA